MHYSPGCRQQRATAPLARPPMTGRHRSTGPGNHHFRPSRARESQHTDTDSDSGNGNGNGNDEDDLQARPAPTAPIRWPTTRDLARIELLFRVRDGIRRL
jgi:hypothetical protein